MSLRYARQAKSGAKVFEGQEVELALPSHGAAIAEAQQTLQPPLKAWRGNRAVTVSRPRRI